MLNNKGFDLWANHYDETVHLSQESNTYPFAGYKEILNLIFNEISQHEQADVLDIGFGTAVLSSQLYEKGYHIDGIDFSSEMIHIAAEKMPNARLYQHDISKGLPREIEDRQYDYIVSTYALHHLNDDEKIQFITQLLSMLKKNGKIIVGDIAFPTQTDHNQCRNESGEHWDSDEHYFVYDKLIKPLKDIGEVSYQQVSHCSGIFTFTN